MVIRGVGSSSVGKAGSGTNLYSSLLILFIPLLPSEVIGPDQAVALTVVLMLVTLALADEPYVAREILLGEVFNFNAADFSAG